MPQKVPERRPKRQKHSAPGRKNRGEASAGRCLKAVSAFSGRPKAASVGKRQRRGSPHKGDKRSHAQEKTGRTETRAAAPKRQEKYGGRKSVPRLGSVLHRRGGQKDAANRRKRPPAPVYAAGSQRASACGASLSSQSASGWVITPVSTRAASTCRCRCRVSSTFASGE